MLLSYGDCEWYIEEVVFRILGIGSLLGCGICKELLVEAGASSCRVEELFWNAVGEIVGLYMHIQNIHVDVFIGTLSRGRRVFLCQSVLLRNNPLVRQ